tara:strand:+ start:6301 stop:7308 length:1008 start_codon:yes stop_codon:yes gene_type:complete
MKNKVALLTAVGRVEIEEQELKYSKKNKGKVLVKMTSVGICGSDIHYFDHGGLGTFKQPLPMPMGHEPAGIIADVSTDSKLNIGTRVAIEPGFSCYHCSSCYTGKHNLCDHVEFMGANAPGALSEYCVLDEDQLVTVPGNMSNDAAALMEPMGIAAHAFSLVPLQYGSKIAVVGAGPIGLCVALYAKMMGLKCILIDTLQYRVDFAKKQGLDACLLGNESNHNNTCDAVFDAAGAGDSFNISTKLCKKSGVVGMIGIPESDYISVNPHTMRTKELVIQNVRRANQTLHNCVNHFSEKPEQLNKLVSHRYGLDDVQKAFELVSDKKDEVIKCMIDC